jgi:hypothetical protein
VYLISSKELPLYNIYNLKRAMAGTHGKYYEDIFGTQFLSL